MNVIAEAASLSASESNLFPRNSGIVAESKCCVMIRVRLPSTAQAIKEPIRAFPIPIHVEAIPYFALICGISYLVSGDTGLYGEQKIMYSRKMPVFINRTLRNKKPEQSSQDDNKK